MAIHATSTGNITSPSVTEDTAGLQHKRRHGHDPHPPAGFRRVHRKPSGFAMIAAMMLALFLFSTLGCGDSDSDPVATPTPPPTPLTDAVWTAFQDGDGPWREIDFPQSGLFEPTVTDSQGRYGLALLRADAGSRRVILQTLQTTSAELPRIDIDRLSMNGNAGLQIDVAEPENFDDSSVRLYCGNYDDWAYAFPFSNTTAMAPGIYDLILTQMESDLPFPTRMLVRRDLDLIAGITLEQTISSADLDGSTALSGPHTIDVQGESGSLDSSSYTATVQLSTANRTQAELGYKSAFDPQLRYTAFDDSLNAGDVYLLNLDITTDDDHWIGYYEGFSAAGDRTATPPTKIFDGAFVPDTSSGSLIPGMADIPVIENANVIGYTIQFEGTGNDIDYSALGHISKARIGSGVSFSMPDLSTAPGWDPNWSMPADTVPEYSTASAHTGSDGNRLQVFADWYFNDTPHLQDGEWFAVSSETIVHDEISLR